MPIGRKELIKRVATKSNKSEKESAVFVNAVLETIREALEAGDSVTLVGFGKFSVKETAPSVRVNPQTREKINVPARKKVKFTTYMELDEATRPPRRRLGPEFFSRIPRVGPTDRNRRLPGKPVTRGPRPTTRETE